MPGVRGHLFSGWQVAGGGLPWKGVVWLIEFAFRFVRSRLLRIGRWFQISGAGNCS